MSAFHVLPVPVAAAAPTLRSTVSPSRRSLASCRPALPAHAVRPAGLAAPRARKVTVAVRAHQGSANDAEGDDRQAQQLLIADLAAGRAPKQERSKEGKQPLGEKLEAAVSGLWGMRRGLAAAAFALVVSLAVRAHIFCMEAQRQRVVEDVSRPCD